jgi:hypothetical protein
MTCIRPVAKILLPAQVKFDLSRMYPVLHNVSHFPGPLLLQPALEQCVSHAATAKLQSYQVNYNRCQTMKTNLMLGLISTVVVSIVKFLIALNSAHAPALFAVNHQTL